MSVRLSARPSVWNNSAPIGQIFTKFVIRVFFETLSRKFKFHYNPTRITDTLNENSFFFTFMRVCRLIILRMINVSYRSYGENRNIFYV
jgi:hypothetical protein